MIMTWLFNMYWNVVFVIFLLYFILCLSNEALLKSIIYYCFFWILVTACSQRTATIICIIICREIKNCFGYFSCSWNGQYPSETCSKWGSYETNLAAVVYCHRGSDWSASTLGWIYTRGTRKRPSYENIAHFLWKWTCQWKGWCWTCKVDKTTMERHLWQKDK